jgi:PKD repeat protein
MPDDVAIKSYSSTQLQALAVDAEMATGTIVEETVRRALLTVRALFDGRQFHIDREYLLELHEILFGAQDLSQIRTDYIAYECALYFWDEAETEAPVAIATAFPQSTSSSSLEVLFTDESAGTITRWLWDFGDGSDPVYTPGGMISHLYEGNGIYFALLTVSNSIGQTDSIQFTIKVGVGQMNLVTEDGDQVTTEDDLDIIVDT